MPHADRIIAGLLLLVIGGAASAAESTTQDWPCVQRKVGNLTSAQLWDGPQVEGLSQWHDNEAITRLLATLTSRRVAVEEAAAAIGRFAEAEPQSERDEALKLLFAGLLATMNAQRNQIIAGIERFQQRQRARAHEIERQGREIQRLKQRAAGDASAQAELTVAEEKYNWDVRVFSERQQSLPLACEVPTLIEQRLFALAREIRAHMRD